DMRNAGEARDRLCAEAKPGIAVVVAGLQLIALDQAATLRPPVAAVVEGSLAQPPAHAIAREHRKPAPGRTRKASDEHGID
ncbi:MAG: hypothetical protein ACTHJW_06805, partial [Streptosporangiaceae bacterium]